MRSIVIELIESLFNQTDDLEVVIFDSGCPEVIEMIENCGYSKEEAQIIAKEYEEEVIKLANCLGWEITEKNNCKAIVIERALLQEDFKPDEEIFNTIDGDYGEAAWRCGEWIIYDPCCEVMQIIHISNFNF